jgi:hypothetical protein
MRAGSILKAAHYPSMFLTIGLSVTTWGFSQTAKPTQNYPAHLPYTFGNFVWWSDEELRALLKKRIPGLGDEMATSTRAKDQMRDALIALLKEKGITADVLSVEPSNFALTGERAPGVPPPSIEFSIESPKILLDKIAYTNAPEDAISVLDQHLKSEEGKRYSSSGDWWVRSEAKQALEAIGYLEAQVDITHDSPRRAGESYLVNQLISIAPGPKYRIASITADGGPLLQGRDLSQFFTEKVGEIAGPGPFGRLAAELRAFYAHYGYADVEIKGPPVLDREHAVVSYHLYVTPGQLYHLRSLGIHNLSPSQEARVRELLGMKVGDVFDETAINALYRKISDDSSFAGYGFSFGPAKDKSAAEVDLTLDFYKQNDNGSVTIK